MFNTINEWRWPGTTHNLRRNPPEVRGKSGQKLSTKIIYSVLQTSVRLFEIPSSKKIIHSNTKRRKRMLIFV